MPEQRKVRLAAPQARFEIGGRQQEILQSIPKTLHGPQYLILMELQHYCIRRSCKMFRTKSSVKA